MPDNENAEITETEDVEGHGRATHVVEDDDDVEGHLRKPHAVEDDDDVEGHRATKF